MVEGCKGTVEYCCGKELAKNGHSRGRGITRCSYDECFGQYHDLKKLLQLVASKYHMGLCENCVVAVGLKW
jgi:hypothetical protein